MHTGILSWLLFFAGNVGLVFWIVDRERVFYTRLFQKKIIVFHLPYLFLFRKDLIHVTRVSII